MVIFGTKENPLVLASASPRRKEICQMLGWEIEIEPAQSEEPWDETVTKEEAVLKIAKGKACEVFKKHPSRVVLGSDTVVLAPTGDVLGKPKDEQEAFSMLSTLSGKTHRVLTAVWVCTPEKQDGFVSSALVTFRPLSEQEIKDYIASGEPMDKAGSYGIQGVGKNFIANLEGDFYTVMGLPKEEQLQFLSKTL